MAHLTEEQIRMVRRNKLVGIGRLSCWDSKAKALRRIRRNWPYSRSISNEVTCSPN